MRSRISIIATVLSLIFAICLWNIIEMGGLYIFDNYYTSFNINLKPKLLNIMILTYIVVIIYYYRELVIGGN